MYSVSQSEKDFPDISVMVFYQMVCYNEAGIFVKVFLKQYEL